MADSAGVFAEFGRGATQNAVYAMAEMGVDIRLHCSKPVDQFLLVATDIFVPMTPAHKNALIEMGVPESKISLLQQSIMDPVWGDIEVYRKCRDEIKAALEKLIENELT